MLFILYYMMNFLKSKQKVVNFINFRINTFKLPFLHYHRILILTNLKAFHNFFNKNITKFDHQYLCHFPNFQKKGINFNFYSLIFYHYKLSIFNLNKFHLFHIFKPNYALYMSFYYLIFMLFLPNCEYLHLFGQYFNLFCH